jgi:4-azaleucine resistance transporter AzlC
MGKAAWYMVFSLTDETYALLCSTAPVGTDREHKRLMLLMSVLDQSYWVSGSLLGALLGEALSFDITGIDFAMTALFTVIVVEQWLANPNHISALLGLLCAIISLLVFGPSAFLLPALVACGTLLMLGKRPLQAYDRYVQTKKTPGKTPKETL